MVIFGGGILKVYAFWDVKSKLANITKMILDHIEKIIIHPGVTPIANYHSINQLKEGLLKLWT